MAINEPVIFVSCDGCHDEVEVQPEYKYLDYSGKNGFYDCSEKAVEKQLENLGWTIKDGNHFCDPDCEEK